MSYLLSGALQTAVYQALTADATLMGLVGGAVYDALPAGAVPELYVMLGAERVRDRSDYEVQAALHEFAITILSDEAGYLGAKEAAARVSEVLNRAQLTLTRGRLVQLDFYKANARQRANRREVELWFRAVVEDAALV